MAAEASKPFGWTPDHWVEWATVTAMTHAVGLQPGSRMIDVGCGVGWTTLFLAEAGFEAHGVDLVEANVAAARERAARWNSRATFATGDMDRLDVPGVPYDAALLFDALHHSARQREVLGNVARAVRPGGWLLIGEPTWLHRLSPGARATTRTRGWLERGLTLRGLRRDLRAAGFTTTRRFFQPTQPYEGRVRGTAWQVARLIGANVIAAPQAHLWVAAQRGYSTVA